MKPENSNKNHARAEAIAAWLIKKAEQIEKNNEKSKRKTSKAELIFGILILVFLFGGCIRSIGSPWTCGEAQAIVEEAEKAYSDSIKNLSEGRQDENTIRQTQAELFALERAKINERRLCESK